MSTGIAFEKHRLISVVLSVLKRFLVQRFWFTPHSSGQTVNSEADFVCEGIRALLKHRHNTCDALQSR